MSLTGRQAEILEYLKVNKHAKIRELSRQLYCSDATIRRDLSDMKKLGLLERNHGGAIILDTADEVAMSVRYGRNAQDKKEVADLTIRRLPGFKVAFFDNSSTSLTLAMQMNLDFKTVVTNSIALASELAKREDVTVLMPGGQLLQNTNSLTGAMAARNLADMHFDLMLASCTALSPEGVYESSINQSEIKRVALRNSSHSALLVDKTKFDLTATHRTASPADFDIIFTNAPKEKYSPLLSVPGVRLISSHKEKPAK